MQLSKTKTNVCESFSLCRMRLMHARICSLLYRINYWDKCVNSSHVHLAWFTFWICVPHHERSDKHVAAATLRLQKHLTNIFTILCDSLLVNVLLVYLSKTNANICVHVCVCCDSAPRNLYRDIQNVACASCWGASGSTTALYGPPEFFKGGYEKYDMPHSVKYRLWWWWWCNI